MSDSSRAPDAHRANREAAKLFSAWAKRAGGHLAQAFAKKRQPKQKRAGAAGGTGQTNGSVASSVPDSYCQQAGMHIPPSQSDAEDAAQFDSLIPEGDDEAERECLDGGRRSLSCHAEPDTRLEQVSNLRNCVSYQLSRPEASHCFLQLLRTGISGLASCCAASS